LYGSIEDRHRSFQSANYSEQLTETVFGIFDYRVCTSGGTEEQQLAIAIDLLALREAMDKPTEEDWTVIQYVKVWAIRIFVASIMIAILVSFVWEGARPRLFTASSLLPPSFLPPPSLLPPSFLPPPPLYITLCVFREVAYGTITPVRLVAAIGTRLSLDFPQGVL